MMPRNPTKAFYICAVIGIAPINTPPKLHFAVALVAVLSYTLVVYRLLKERGPQGDERGTEMSDSVYFLGFVLTMGVLGGAFLFGGADKDQLLHAVGYGVGLTLVGLAIRVGLTLSFGGSGSATSSSVSGPSIAEQGGSALAGPVLSMEELEEQSKEIGRLNAETRAETRDVTTRMTRMARSSIAAMDKLLEKNDHLASQLDSWKDAVNAIEQDFGGVTDQLAHTVKDSVSKVGTTFAAGAAEFTAQVNQARNDLAQALIGAHEQQQELNAIIARNLAASAAAADRIQRLSDRQLQDFGRVVDDIARLAEEVRVRTQAIPNPADILAGGLQQMTAAADDTSRALQSASNAAVESARSLALVSSSAANLPASMRVVGPGVEDAVSTLRKEVEASAQELSKQVAVIDKLLGEFAKLIEVRIKDSRR
jgi:ABC-type transporter Mla subunit MlaD